MFCYEILFILCIGRGKTYRVTCGIQIGQQLTVDESLGVVDNDVHDHLRHLVLAGCSHNLHVGVHQVPDRLHLPLKLWVHGTSTDTARLLKSDF